MLMVMILLFTDLAVLLQRFTTPVLKLMQPTSPGLSKMFDKFSRGMGGSLGGVSCKRSVVFCVSHPFAKMKIEKEYQVLFLGGGGKSQTKTPKNTKPTPKQTSR